MKVQLKYICVATLVALIPMVVYGACYGSLPGEIATSFDMAGNPQGYTSREGMWWMLLLPLLILAVLVVIPTMDPRGKSYAKLGDFYPAFIIGLMAFFAVLFSAIVLHGLPNVEIPIEKVVTGCVGVLFLVLGNYMPKMKQSYTMGVKTPWTLDSEVVWNKTHRLAGPCFMVAGLTMLVSLWLPNHLMFALTMVSVFVAGGVPSGMSYVYYRKEMQG